MGAFSQIRAVLSIHRVIRYESLVAQPEASLRGCLDAIHLPMHEGVVHPERNLRIPITLSHRQAREPISSTSLGSRASRALRSWRIRARSCSRLAGNCVSSGE
jgi:hypothetical protein